MRGCRPLDKDEVATILKATLGLFPKPVARRNHAMFLTMLGTGLRVGECRVWRVRDVAVAGVVGDPAGTRSYLSPAGHDAIRKEQLIAQHPVINNYYNVRAEQAVFQSGPNSTATAISQQGVDAEAEKKQNARYKAKAKNKDVKPTPPTRSERLALRGNLLKALGIVVAVLAILVTVSCLVIQLVYPDELKAWWLDTFHGQSSVLE